MEMRIISPQKLAEQFSKEELEELKKRGLSLPEVIELETEKWVARYYVTPSYGYNEYGSLISLNSSWGEQLIEIVDKKTGFKITKFVSDLGRTWPLKKMIEANGCELYKDEHFFKSVPPQILEETIDTLWKEITGPGSIRVERYKGIIIRVS